MADDSADTLRLIERARAGDAEALNEIFARHRGRLRRRVEVRLDWRLQARVDPSDVIREAYLEAVGRLDEFLQEPRLPPFLWLRRVAASGS